MNVLQVIVWQCKFHNRHLQMDFFGVSESFEDAIETESRMFTLQPRASALSIHTSASAGTISEGLASLKYTFSRAYISCKGTILAKIEEIKAFHNDHFSMLRVLFHFCKIFHTQYAPGFLCMR